MQGVGRDRLCITSILVRVWSGVLVSGLALQGGQKFLLLEETWWFLGDALLFLGAPSHWWVTGLFLEGLLGVDFKVPSRLG